MTRLVGILNYTPDSFSGDGKHGSVSAALAHIEKMIEAGAAIVDIGAESTRPGAQALSWQEEWDRLEPLINAVETYLTRAQFSIDTRHSETAQKALDKGFHWVNDVSGCADTNMPDVLKSSGCSYVAMHSLSVPANPLQTISENKDIVDEIMLWAKNIIRKLEVQGINRSRIIIDPGIGFGKTPEQSLALIKNIAAFKMLDAPILVGHSRKSFLSQFTGGDQALRDAATLCVSRYLIAQHVDYLRIHDVASHSMLQRIEAVL